jgi:hypothetical protein
LATDVQLVNLALLRIGVKALITSLSDTSTEGVVALNTYATVRDSLLSRAWWPFATKRAALSLAAGVTRSGWQYAYALPNDCLAPQYLFTGTRRPASGQRVPFQVEATGAFPAALPVLLTDAKDAELVYTASVSAGAFDALFADALAWALAAEFTLSLAVQPAVAQRALQMAEVSFLRAVTAAHRASEPDVPPESEFILARG